MPEHQLPSVLLAGGSEQPVLDSRFQVRERLGARSYLARDELSGRDVVVKAIPVSRVAVSSLMQLEYEAAERQRLSSPWVVSPLYVGRAGDQLIFVSPHVPGMTLDECLQQRRLTIAEALRVGLAMFSALRDLHARGLLHRAVRPCHLIVSDEVPLSAARLLDFGLPPSSLMEDTVRMPEILSAAHYISPEQAGSIDQDATETADLYSAGVTLFHCLAGRPPFTGSEVGTILFEHMTARPPRLRTLGIAVPRALEEVTQHLLRKDPQDRYQTAAAVVTDLHAIVAGQERGDRDPLVVVGTSDARRSLSEPAFVGRGHELKQLDQQLDHTQQGRPGLVLLEGESGGGKTRLLTEVTQRAASRGFAVLWGEGTNDVARQPFSLLRGLVDGFLQEAESDLEYAALVRQRLGDQAAAVCAALPRLAGLLGQPDTFTSVPEAAGEARTLNALTNFLRAGHQRSTRAVRAGRLPMGRRSHLPIDPSLGNTDAHVARRKPRVADRRLPIGGSPRRPLAAPHAAHAASGTERFFAGGNAATGGVDGGAAADGSRRSRHAPGRQ